MRQPRILRGRLLSARATASRSSAVHLDRTEDYHAFTRRDLSSVDYVYVWADGVVRHEALHDQVEVKDLHRSAVVAAG